MSDKWLKFGCFLTGYNYQLVKHSSLASAKTVNKFTSAILLVSLVWCFIGYCFTQRYLGAGLIGCIAGAIIMAFAIVQIERQIILTFGGNNSVVRLRIGLAIVMALIGAIIVDQLIFAKDVEIARRDKISEDVKKQLGSRTVELDSQINSKAAEILAIGKQRDSLIAIFYAHPTIPAYNKQSTFYKPKDSSGKQDVSGKTNEEGYMENPAGQQAARMDTLLDSKRKELIEKQDTKSNIRDTLYKEIQEQKGFLDELGVFFNLLFSSPIAIVTWLLFLAFFLFIELLVVFSKKGDKKNDYEYILLHQMNVRIDQLKALRDEEK